MWGIYSKLILYTKKGYWKSNILSYLINFANVHTIYTFLTFACCAFLSFRRLHFENE